MDGRYVGIDVAKATLEVGSETGPIGAYPNDATGIAGLVAAVQALAPPLVVLEATGGYEGAVASALALAGIGVAVVNPRHVRDFAKALGILAKTDAIDARVLALFAARVRPDVRPLADEAAADLRALVTRRQQLVEMLTAERQRLARARPAVQASLQESIRWLEAQLREVDRDTTTQIRRSPLWRTRDQLQRSIPGIGPRTSARLLVSLPELGRLPTRQISKLAGVAPLNADSGQRHGPRQIWGGRADVRRALYMAAVVGTQHNPVLAACYRRWRQAGKPAKVALVAVMHKLVAILNAILRQQQPWTLTPGRPSTAPTPSLGRRAQGAPA